MTNYSVYLLRDGERPLRDGIAPTKGGEADSSDDVVGLINGTNPGRIVEVGNTYGKIAGMCGESVRLLYEQAKLLADSLGGEPLEGVFKKIGELQKDLAQVDWAAQTVARPLVWYGEQVLPWFRNNVPRTGDVGLDDDLGDAFGSDGNAHALARHHLRQLNTFMGDVYDGIAPELEQRASPPPGGAIGTPGLPTGLTGLPPGGPGGVTDPYAQGGVGPFSGPDLPGLTDPNAPGFGDPPGAQNPGPDPSVPLPGGPGGVGGGPQTPDPNLPDPNGTLPASPDLKSPDLKTPDYKTPEFPANPYKTDLSGVPNTALPNSTGNPLTTTGMPPTGPQSPFGTASVAQGGVGTAGLGGARVGAGGMGMGMMPPMMGGAQADQNQQRETTRLPLVEDEAFETDDLGGPAVIA